MFKEKMNQVVLANLKLDEKPETRSFMVSNVYDCPISQQLCTTIYMYVKR